MITPLPALLFGVAALASPVLEVRTVTALNQAAFEEAQQRDNTATRAFSSTAIKTSDGNCIFVDELSGDFRANLTPVQVAACDGSAGQQWDIITAGRHDDEAGTMLVVSSLTQACLNFDPRRAAGNQVILFSCGGRADGGGAVTNSQLFSFTGGAGPLSLKPLNQAGTCLTATSGNVLDQAACASGDEKQSFTFSGGSSSSAPASSAALASTSKSSTAKSVCDVTFITEIRGASSSPSTPEAIATTSVVSTSSSTSFAEVVATTSVVGSSLSVATTTAGAIQQSEADANPTTPVPVSRAGGVLQPSSAAEANPRDNTAKRALSSVSIRDTSGQCLFIDPTAGDFRQNLIPVQVQACTGSAGEKFDFITAGVHNNAPNSTLIVSSLTQGCLNFDPRRAAGDTVILFSCGGRGDGSGQVTSSQLFPFTAGETSFTLAPENQNGGTCLVPLNGKIDAANCAAGDAGQVYTTV